MATPRVAGLAALLFQAKPTASIDEVENAILQSCTLAPGMFASRPNRGYPDAVKALALLTGINLNASESTKKSSKKAVSKAGADSEGR